MLNESQEGRIKETQFLERKICSLIIIVHWSWGSIVFSWCTWLLLCLEMHESVHWFRWSSYAKSSYPSGRHPQYYLRFEHHELRVLPNLSLLWLLDQDPESFLNYLYLSTLNCNFLTLYRALSANLKLSFISSIRESHSSRYIIAISR